MTKFIAAESRIHRERSAAKSVMTLRRIAKAYNAGGVLGDTSPCNTHEPHRPEGAKDLGFLAVANAGVAWCRDGQIKPDHPPPSRFAQLNVLEPAGPRRQAAGLRNPAGGRGPSLFHFGPRAGIVMLAGSRLPIVQPASRIRRKTFGTQWVIRFAKRPATHAEHSLAEPVARTSEQT